MSNVAASSQASVSPPNSTTAPPNGTLTKSASSSAIAATTLASKPTLIEWGKLRFLIMDSPKESNLHLYLREAKKHNVTDLVRVCEECYPASEVEAAGIKMHEMKYDDGDSPPRDVIDRWLTVVDEVFLKRKQQPEQDPPAIAVHCVAGLGRAPVLVALALIENGFGDPGSVVEFIRSQRRGAINQKQLNYLEQYQKKSGSGLCCTIM